MLKMMDNVVPFQTVPSVKEAEEITRRLIQEGKLSLSFHCKARMEERDITIQQVLTCLSKGKITDGPFLSYRSGGGYEVTVDRTSAGNHLRVGVCLKFSQRLLVITAIKY